MHDSNLENLEYYSTQELLTSVYHVSCSRDARLGLNTQSVSVTESTWKSEIFEKLNEVSGKGVPRRYFDVNRSSMTNIHLENPSSGLTNNENQTFR